MAAVEASPSLKNMKKKFPKHLVETYDIDVMVGQGAFSTVWRCTHRATGQVRAVKRIDTTELHPREIAHEIALMKLLRHSCVTRVYDVFLENQFVNIVVDMFNGGDLVDGLNAHRRSRGRLPDRQLAHLTRQMVAAVAHIHGLQIIHRDIKGENFLADRPDIGDPACRVALADFGTAMRIDTHERLTSKVGTPSFWAPEIWEGSYGFPVDIWATGVTTFILLTGTLPFDGESQICRPVPSGEAPVDRPSFASRRCMDFVTACLQKDPQRRPMAAAAQEHAWLNPPREVPSNNMEALQPLFDMERPRLRGPDIEMPSLVLGLLVDCFPDCFHGMTVACGAGLWHLARSIAGCMACWEYRRERLAAAMSPPAERWPQQEPQRPEPPQKAGPGRDAAGPSHPTTAGPPSSAVRC